MSKPSARETCRMCSTTQHVTPGHRIVPAMYRGHDGFSYCADAIDCLARRRDVISKMERGLGRAWAMLDDLAVRAGWPACIRVAVIAAVVAEPRPIFGYSSGPVSGFRRTANARATLVHRVFIPMWISLGGSYKWVPWSAEVQV